MVTSGNGRSRDHIKFPPELLPQAQAVLDWAIENAAPNMHKALIPSVLNLIRGNMVELMDQMSKDANSISGDRRVTAYGARIVLQKGDDLEGASPWRYGLGGLDAVWQYAAQTVKEAHGLKDCPTGTSPAELKARENTTRVAMSRKANGIAAIRVEYPVMEEHKSVRRGGESTWIPAMFNIRIDIGAEGNARALDLSERDARSPLVVD